MPFSAILFDLDGTLIDSPKLWREAYRRVLKDIGHTLCDKDFGHLYPSGKPMRDWLMELGIDQSHYATLRTNRDRIYEEMLRSEIVWHDGAETCFKTIARKISHGDRDGIAQNLHRCDRTPHSAAVNGECYSMKQTLKGI